MVTATHSGTAPPRPQKQFSVTVAKLRLCFCTLHVVLVCVTDRAPWRELRGFTNAGRAAEWRSQHAAAQRAHERWGGAAQFGLGSNMLERGRYQCSGEKWWRTLGGRLEATKKRASQWRGQAVAEFAKRAVLAEAILDWWGVAWRQVAACGAIEP